MALRLGSTAVDKVFAGADAVSKIYVGTDEVWSASSAVGMEKAGNQQLANSSAMQSVQPWRARSGFGGVLSGAGVLVAAGTYDVVVHLEALANNNVSNRRFQLLVGSTVVIAPTQFAVPLHHTVRLTVPAGVVELQAYASTVTTNFRTIVDGSYVTLTPVT